MVVIAPGSLYGSLGAALVVGGVADALAGSPARKVYVCNLVGEHGQTDDFKTHDYASEIERFLGGKTKLDYVLYNTGKPDAGLLQRYFTQEGRAWVGYDKTALDKQHYTAIGGDFLANGGNHSRTFIRHDGNKVAASLMDILRVGRGKVKQ